MSKAQNEEVMKINKSDDHISKIHDYQLDIQNNNIYLFPWKELAGFTEFPGTEPGVEFTMSSKFILNARLCMQSNPNSPLMVHMKTCGGDWNEGMAIFDMLINYPCDTTILNYTHARSMSSIIFQAATKRVMMPHSYFMFHDGTYSDSGTLKTVLSGLAFYDKTGPVMLNLYTERMKQRGKFSSWSRERIKDFLVDEMNKKEDVYLTAKEAVEWGLADSIFDGNWGGLVSYTDTQSKNALSFAEIFKQGC